MSLQMNKITSEEDYLGIGWTAPLEHQFFDFVQESLNQPTIESSYAEIIVGLNPNIVEHQRSIYTVFDFLGDIGGLYGTLSVIGYGIVFAYSNLLHNGLNTYIFKSL